MKAAVGATRLGRLESDFGHPDASNTTSRWQNRHRLGFSFEPHHPNSDVTPKPGLRVKPNQLPPQLIFTTIERIRAPTSASPRANERSVELVTASLCVRLPWGQQLPHPGRLSTPFPILVSVTTDSVIYD